MEHLLQGETEINYGEYEDIKPYNLIVDGKWSSLYFSAHPIRNLIKRRFASDYNGKLLWKEIELKRTLLKKKEEELEAYEKKVKPLVLALEIKLQAQLRECANTPSCKENLQKHLGTCPSVPKCRVNFIHYDCEFGNNTGKCSHLYKIDQLECQLDHYNVDDRESEINDLNYDYQRALACKENRLEEFSRQILEDYEDYCYY